MSFVKALSAVVAGAVALSMGCSDAGDGSELGAYDIDDPLYSALTGGSDGTNGQNHLPPEYYIDYRDALLEATKSNLANYNAGTSKWILASNAHTSALRATAAGRQVLKYAIQCALPVGQAVWYTIWVGGFAMQLSPTGQGFLTTTTGWDTGALTTAQAEDLFACVVAHLNPYTQVAINLSGPRVTNDPNADTTDFTWEEALWLVDIRSPLGIPSIDVRVWPLGGVLACGSYVDQIETRLCGSYAGGASCDVDVRLNLAGECVQGIGGWYCRDIAGNYAPVIKSRLKVDDASTIYGVCH
jgi:hypothetical protein